MKYISVIYCRYYFNDSRFEKSLRLLKKIYTDSILNVVVVQNRGFGNFKSAIQNVNITVIQSDNRLLDFSAYADGLLHLISSGMGAPYILVNETLFTKLPTNYLLKSIHRELNRITITTTPCATGFSATYQYFLQQNPWSLSTTYLCSACFAVNHVAATLLLNLIKNAESQISITEAQGQATDVNRELFKLTGAQFFSYLQLLLLQEKSPGWNPESLDHLQTDIKYKKALCFYLEHRFSGEIQNHDGGLIFINRGKDAPFFSFLLRAATLRYKLISRMR